MKGMKGRWFDTFCYDLKQVQALAAERGWRVYEVSIKNPRANYWYTGPELPKRIRLGVVKGTHKVSERKV